MRTTDFQVSGKVIGKARPRFTRDGHVFTPTSTRIYENAIRQSYLAAGGGCIGGAIRIDIEAVAGIQKSASKKTRAVRLMGNELSLSKPDVDNIAKVVLDALNGVAYMDDAQVVSVRIIKGRYEEAPRLLVRVQEIEPSDILSAHSYMWDNA